MLRGHELVQKETERQIVNFPLETFEFDIEL